MNQYSELLTYIKQIAEQNTYLNTITKGVDIDLNKANIFPLFNIEINSGSLNNGTVTFAVELDCLDIRDINKEIVNDKFWEQDNEVDNHNNTFATLNRLWRIMNRDFNNNNITASDNPTITKITYSDKNLLDGWQMSFDVELPNTTLSLCEESC